MNQDGALTESAAASTAQDGGLP